MNSVTLNNFKPTYNFEQTKQINIKLTNPDPSFGNKISIPFSKKALILEKCHQKIEFLARKIINKVNVAINHKKINKVYNEVVNIDEQSPKYMKMIYDFGKMMSKRNEIEINVENNALMDIAKAKESCIFIMNHDNQRQDPKLLAFFNSLLTREYIYNGKAKTCPRPKIIVNDDILGSLNPKSRAIYEKVGAVGVDASLFLPHLGKNGRNMLATVSKVIENKANLYIFPEGKMCVFRNLDPEYKFQTGVADIVKFISERKNRVKVVPLGFAYKGKIGSIHIGEPIYIKKNKEKTLITSGSVDSSFASKEYVDFFKKNTSTKKPFATITKRDVPVEGNDLPDYIAGVLCENLKICKAEAKKAISKGSSENVPIYHVKLTENEK